MYFTKVAIKIANGCSCTWMLNKWDKGVAPAICLCIFRAGEYLPTAGAATADICWTVASSLYQEQLHKRGSKYSGGNSWSHTYLQGVLYYVMDTLISGTRGRTIIFSQGLEEIQRFSGVQRSHGRISYSFWQTMLYNTTIVIDTAKYPAGFAVVVVASPTDHLCQVNRDSVVPGQFLSSSRYSSGPTGVRPPTARCPPRRSAWPSGATPATPTTSTCPWAL